MNKKVKEPLFNSSLINMILGIAILVMMLVLIFQGSKVKFLEMIIFALAAAMNFVSATNCFMQQRIARGNMYATLCAVFLIVAVFFAVRYFIFV